MSKTASAHTTFLLPLELQGTEITLECQWINPEQTDAELLVFLHEGLGSVSMWKDWPAQMCRAAGCRGLVFSRYGYGQSTPRPLDQPRSPDYLHIEAEYALPALFSALGIANERPVLFGHSDGGSIALLYAALYPERVKGIAVAAPHIFVEDITIEGIRAARAIYLSTELRQILGRYHGDPDSVFWSWNDTWLKPDFRNWNIEKLVTQIRCPVLAIQGENDEYGSLEQIEGIKRLAPQTELCILADCGHIPQRDQPAALIRELSGFINRL
ncbi:MAG: alpha/beta hydrolase [Pusillimonas sp.]